MTDKEEIMTCLHCGNKTAHKQVIQYAQEVPLTPWEGMEVLTYNYVFLFECKTCKGLSLKQVYSEQIDTLDKINFDGIDSLYPISREFPEDMPQNIVKSYREAKKVKRISPLAFTILVRKSLEELCKDQNAKGKNLKEKILSMAKGRSLPRSFIEMIESIRIFGNIGAHETQTDFTKNQVDTLDDFFVAVVEYVYIAPSRIKSLQESLKKVDEQI